MNNKQSARSFASLLETSSIPELGPRCRPDAKSIPGIESELNGFPGYIALPSSRAQAIKSLLLLWHDHLDASHGISQSLHDETGSYIHGLMHRREPDYFNAKYWFRRVPKHPAFEKFSSELKEKLGSAPEAELLIEGGQWNPFVFVDLCEKAERGHDKHFIQTFKKVQQLEFHALVQWLVR